MLQIFKKETERNFSKSQKDFLLLRDFGELYYLD